MHHKNVGTRSGYLTAVIALALIVMVGAEIGTAGAQTPLLQNPPLFLQQNPPPLCVPNTLALSTPAVSFALATIGLEIIGPQFAELNPCEQAWSFCCGGDGKSLDAVFGGCRGRNAGKCAFDYLNCEFIVAQ